MRRGTENFDFDRIGDVRPLVHLNGNDEPLTPGGGLVDMGAQLQQEQSRRLRLRAALGDLGKTSNLLQQFHNSHFSSHTLKTARLVAIHVPSQRRNIPLGRPLPFWLARRAE